MPSAWQIHLTKFRSANPQLSLREAMQAASKSYRGGTKASVKEKSTKKTTHSVTYRSFGGKSVYIPEEGLKIGTQTFSKQTLSDIIKALEKLRLEKEQAEIPQSFSGYTDEEEYYGGDWHNR